MLTRAVRLPILTTINSGLTSFALDTPHNDLDATGTTYFASFPSPSIEVGHTSPAQMERCFTHDIIHFVFGLFSLLKPTGAHRPACLISRKNTGTKRMYCHGDGASD